MTSLVRISQTTALGPINLPIFLTSLCVLLLSCRSVDVSVKPTIEFTRVPQADPGGREKNDIIEGLVKRGRPGQRIVLYARSGKWWVQPLVNNPFTGIQPSSKWSNATHLGTEYAALLVQPDFHPQPWVVSLPPVTGSVLAVAVVPGAKTPPSTTVSFSGYDWRVRDAPSNRGGPNKYASTNVSVDDSGALHMRIAKDAADWSCAEVSLTRSLGYGEYRFQVRDTSHLEPAAVFSMLTWDYSGGDQANREVDIELSRWGDPASKNAQYVIQPYSVPANVARFMVPEGPMIHSFQWEPGRMVFRTTHTSGKGFRESFIAEHVFTSGVPSPGIESVRMNIYVFRRSKEVLRNQQEVVIDRFQYLP